MNDSFLTLLAALGGAGVVVLGLSAFLGKVWSERIIGRERMAAARELEHERMFANRALEHEKAQFSRELELLRAELQATNDHSRRVTDARFALYADVWERLQRLRDAGDDLWRNATRLTAEQFGLAFLEAKAATNRGRLILREHDYQELQQVFATFAQYDLGKRKLITLRSVEDIRDDAHRVRPDVIAMQIEQNGVARQRYDELIDQIARQFRGTLGTAA